MTGPQKTYLKTPSPQYIFTYIYVYRQDGGYFLRGVSPVKTVKKKKRVEVNQH